ncbi:MAG: metalloregulator ArsR/SmtB family transcription factor [Pseudomonadota bacterium]
MNTFNALADPTRRKIVELLSDSDKSVNELATHFDCSQPAISQHLKKLNSAGLVNIEKQAQKRIYKLDPQGFIELEIWMAKVKQYWNPRLDKLESELNKGED